jgi:hypothetical protein
MTTTAAEDFKITFVFCIRQGSGNAKKALETLEAAGLKVEFYKQPKQRTKQLQCIVENETDYNTAKMYFFNDNFNTPN